MYADEDMTRMFPDAGPIPHDGEGATSRLARWASRLSYADLPDPVRTKLGTLLLDWLACALGGAHEDPVPRLLRAVDEEGTGRGATLLAGREASPRQVAFVNAAAGHVLEFDDIYSPGVFHPGTVVIPAALAAGEAARTNGEEFLAALAAGYEVGNRIAAALGPVHYRYWHMTGTAGTLAAAAAAGRAYGLAPDRMGDALGTAGTMAAGLWEFNRTGAMSKVLHAAKAASDGVWAATLARAGLTGAPAILEGPQGLFAAMGGGADVPKEWPDGLGSAYTLLTVMTKAYPCCGHSHTAVEAACRLHRVLAQNGGRLRQVTVTTNRTGTEITGHRAPRSAVQARFSLSYCVAAALLHGALTLADFREPALSHPATREIEDRVRVVVSQEYDRDFPRCRTAAVALIFDDAGRAEEVVTSRKGEPENPMAAEDFLDKVRGLIGGRSEDTTGLVTLVRDVAREEDIGAWARAVARYAPGTARRT